MAKAPDPRRLRAEQAEKRAKAKAEAFNRYEVKLHVGHEVYTFRAGDVNPLHTQMLKEATGTNLVDPVYYLLVYTNDEQAPLDHVAQLVWLARLQAGEDVSYKTVATGITASLPTWVEVPEGDMPEPEGEVAFPDPPPSDGSSEG